MNSRMYRAISHYCLSVVVVVCLAGAFSVAADTAPHIISMSPTMGPVGTAITIVGTAFGAEEGSSTVSFHGSPVTPTSWSDAQIVVLVPKGATTGPVVVTVGAQSNGLKFTVTPSQGRTD